MLSLVLVGVMLLWRYLCLWPLPQIEGAGWLDRKLLLVWHEHRHPLAL